VHSGVVLVVLAAVAWGTWSLFVRSVELPAAAITPIVFAIMGVATLPLALRGAATRWDRSLFALLVVNAGLDALNVLAFFAALDTTTLAIATLTHYLAPIFVALAAARVDGVATRAARPAAAVAFVGLAIVLEPWRAPAAGALAGAALGAASACFYAGNVFVVKRVAARIGAARQLSYHALVAAAMTAPLVAVARAAPTATELARVGFGALMCGAAAGIAFAVGLGRIGSARTAILCYVEPLVAVVVGALVWHEPIEPTAALGGALVLGAGIHVARGAVE
jgi:drug/metabolite transporter (DMT)-like permease